MPRLAASKSKGLSKQTGALSIFQYRQAGASASDILELLAKSALVNPDEGWYLANVKERPRLVKDFQKLI
jgi:hypothetical protein